MCTSISFPGYPHCFGRNLDLDYHYQETVTIIPRNYPLRYRFEIDMPSHYAIIGMATMDNGYPLLYDATNEFGLSIAGLNFPRCATYLAKVIGCKNIAPFELIPWVLGQCKTVKEARSLLENTRIINEPYSTNYPLTPLHWLLADKKEALTIEPMADGLDIIDNPVGVLTNSPSFPFQMWNLSNYMGISAATPECRISKKIQLEPYSLGMGAIGLPGDLCSASRFVRAAFVKLNSPSEVTEKQRINQFFHILGAVAQQDGCCRTAKGFEKTIYSSCCDTDKCIYYYNTYECRQICAVDMYKADLNSKRIYEYPLLTTQNIYRVN